VRASAQSSRIFANDFALNFASPVDSASSINKMSGSMCTATENAKRPNIPDE
jgi:hypothetical protein